MLSSDAPGDHDERRTLAPIDGRPRAGLLRVMGAGVLVVAMLAFAVGYRLGSTGSTVASSPPPSATPSAALAPSADVLPDAVSRRLRGAVAARGASRWVVCAVGADLRCEQLDVQPLDRPYSDVAYIFMADDWAGLTPTTVHGAHLIIAAELDGYGMAAIVVRLDEGSNPIDSRLLVAVNPDQQGIDYFDVGPVTPGRYVVALGSLAQTSDLAPPAYAWAYYIAGLIVESASVSP